MKRNYVLLLVSVLCMLSTRRLQRRESGSALGDVQPAIRIWIYQKGVFGTLSRKQLSFSSKKFPVADRRPILFCICIWADRFEATCVMDEIFRRFNELMGMGSKYFLPLKNGPALDLAAITLKLAPSRIKSKGAMRMYSRKKRLSLWSTLLVLFLSVLLSMTARTSRVLDVVHSADPESVFSFVGQTRQNVLEAYPQCQESEPWSTILSEKGLRMPLHRGCSLCDGHAASG